MPRCATRSRLAALVAAAICACYSIAPAGAQTPRAQATLTVSGDVSTPLTLTRADIRAMPRTAVVLSEGAIQVKYEGVLVSEVLKRAGATLGVRLSGPALTTYVLASGTDGYQVVFSLAELDPAFSSNDVLIADTLEGKPLSPDQGTFRLVTPDDRRAARSVRSLQMLTVVRVRK